LDYFWKSEELQRSRLLAFQRRNVSLCKKFAVQLIITSDAYSHLDLRAPRQLKALAGLLLLDDSEADIALSKAPLSIMKRRRQKKEANL
jgi:ribonuclease P/MRP protein subunit RPP1